jgi:hypothetical protein
MVIALVSVADVDVKVVVVDVVLDVDAQYVTPLKSKHSVPEEAAATTDAFAFDLSAWNMHA